MFFVCLNPALHWCSPLDGKFTPPKWPILCRVGR